MKITRFAQSCLLVEANGKRILVDPGYIELLNVKLFKYFYFVLPILIFRTPDLLYLTLGIYEVFL